MNPALIIAINAFSLINRLRDGGAFDEVRAQYEALRAQLTAELPAKSDGTPWTEGDLAALATEHNAITQQIRERHQG